MELKQASKTNSEGCEDNERYTTRNLLISLGGFGRFHFIWFPLLLFVSLSVSFMGLTTIITLTNVEHKCYIEKRNEEPYKSVSQNDWDTIAYPKGDPYCRMFTDFNGTDHTSTHTQECESFLVSHTKEVHTTATADFDLFCDREYLKQTANSVFFVGQAVGMSISGQMSDAYGRKKVLIVCQIVSLVSAFGTAFVTEFWIFMCFRFVSGLGFAAAYLAVYNIVLELLSPTKAVMGGFSLEAVFGLGVACVGFAAYFFREWRHLQMAVAIISLPTIPIVIFGPESIRWLVTSGRLEQAKNLASRIAKANNVEDEDYLDIIEGTYKKQKEDAMSSSKVDKDEKTSLYIIEIMKTEKLNWRILVAAFGWFVTTGTYYGLSMQAGSIIPGNIFVNVAVSGLTAVPACALGYPIAQRVGRKFLLVLSFLLSGSSCSLILLTHQRSDLATQILAQTGKLAATACFAVIYVYTSELLPTCARSTGMGFCSLFARFAAILCPYASLVSSRIWEPLNFLVFGAFGITAGLLTMFLPETLGEPMQETLEDAKYLGRKKSQRTKVVQISTN